MANEVKDPIGRIAEQLSNDSRILQCKTYEGVTDVICDILQAQYHCQRKYVEHYAFDIAESVCLKLGIDC